MIPLDFGKELKSTNLGKVGTKEEYVNFNGTKNENEYESVSKDGYKTILSKYKSFVSIDPSKTSTGYVVYQDNKIVKQGCYKTQTDFLEDAVGMRREYREFLKDIFGDYEYDVVFIENTIGGINFETNTILTQLNPIVDDMIDMGIIHAKRVVREGNTVWKKYLKKISNYKSHIVAHSDDKLEIREALKILGYGDGTTNTIVQDTYDAMGIAIGCIVREDMEGVVGIKKKRLSPNINSGYKVKLFYAEKDALEYANKRAVKNEKDIIYVDFTHNNKKIETNFKELINENEYTDKNYLLYVKSIKTGLIGVENDIDTDEENVFVYAYK